MYGLGLVGSLDGVIFDWREVDTIPNEAEFLAYGLDWGFSSDPTALIEVWQDKNKLYIKELIYSTGLTNGDIINEMYKLNVDRYREIIADSAEPKSIEDIYRGGFKNIYPAKKGADSIRNSIDKLQQFELFITSDSTNLKRELSSYIWTKDKHGVQTNNPIDFNNHGIDALRYVALNKIGEDSMSFY